MDKTYSHYKRLQRFFRHYEIDYAEIAQAVVILMAIPERAGTLNRPHRMAVWRLRFQHPNVRGGA